jgi:hypothetical protein
VNKNAPDWTCHGVYVHETREVRWWVPGFGSTIPTLCLNFAVREGRVGENGDVRGGWSKFIGTPYSTPHTSVLFSRVLTVPRSAFWQPYLGFMSPAPLLTRADEPVSLSDNGTAFRTYFVSRAWTLDPQQVVKQIIRAWITAMAVTGGTVTLTTIRNYGDERRSSAADLTPNPLSQGPGTPEPTSVQRRFDNASLTDAWAFQFEVGDPVAFSGATLFGVLDQLFVTVEYGDET